MTKRSICGYCKRSFTDTPYIEQGAPFCSADCALAFRAKTGGGGGGSGLKHAFEHDKLTLKRNLDTAGVGFLVDVAPYVAKGVLAVGGLAVTGLVAGGKLAAKKAQEHAEKKEQERLLAEQIARERLAAARAAAKSAVAAAKNTGADNAAANFLHPKTSSINPWSYAVPVFFKDLNLPLNEEEGTALIDNQELPFTYEVRMCTFGAEVKSAGDLPLPQEWTVSNKKNTKIDGFPAVCYECHTEDVYFQAAYLTYNQKAGIHFGLNIGVPKDDKQEYKELMDAFINSFKVDEKKIQAKYGKEIVGKVEAVDYTEALLKKCPKLKNANQDGSNFSFPVKFTTDETAKFQDVLKAFEEIPQAAKDDSFPIVIVSSTGIFGSQKKGMLLTKKAIYCHQNYGEGPNYLPWQSINKIAPSKKQKGKKLVDCLLIELQSGRNFTTEQIAPKDSVFDILNIMWQDFGGEKAAAKNAELAEQNASRKAEIAAMKGKAAKYIEGLLEKCGTPANDSGFFPAKQNAESFNDMFFNEKLSKDEYPVFCSANIMLTNKAVYAAPFFDKNASRDPWPSITKIAEKKALFGNKVFVELQEAGNIVTRELASGDNKQHDYTVKVLNQMLIDFSGSPPQSTPEPQPATTLGTAQTCGGCGATLKEGAEFCTACGAACGAACGVKCGTKAEVQPEPAPAPQPAAVQQEPAPATKPAAVQPEPAPAVQPAAVRPEPAHATQPAAVQPEQAPAVQPAAVRPEQAPAVQPAVVRPEQAPAVQPAVVRPEPAPATKPAAVQPEPAHATKPAAVQPEPAHAPQPAAVQPEQAPAVQPAVVRPEPAHATQPAAVQSEPVHATQPAAAQPEPAHATQPAAVQPEPVPATQPAAVQPEPAHATKPAAVQPEPAHAPQPAAVQPEQVPATKPAAVQPEQAPAVQPAAVRPEPAHAVQPAVVRPEPAPAAQPAAVQTKPAHATQPAEVRPEPAHATQPAASISCASCGNALKSTAKFCGKCGTTVVQARVCGSCRKELKPTAKFCPICGASQ